MHDWLADDLVMILDIVRGLLEFLGLRLFGVEVEMFL
jgi:hypothetical protein